MRFRGHIAVMVMMMAATATWGQQPALSPDERAGNAAVAERLAQMAQMTLGGKTIVPATLRHSAALLEAACKLDPAEPRFSRLLTEAYLQLGGEEGRNGAIEAIGMYLRAEPADRAVQIKLIDLHCGKMDTADARIKYVEQIVQTEALPAEVRSHAAVLGARIALERTADAQAQQYLEKALALNPLNPAALRLQYELLAPDAPPGQRVRLLLQMIRSNPAQPGAMLELAGELADAGLVDPSLTWYAQAFDVATRLGMPPNPDQVSVYAAQLVVADQLRSAQTLVQRLLQGDPANSDAAFLLLLIEKRGGSSEAIDKARQQTRDALMLRLTRVGQQLDGQSTEAATQPSTDVDLAADIKKLHDSGDQNLVSAYAAGLADLAWLEIYFNEKPADAQAYLGHLRLLLPDGNATLARLEGWSYLIEGRFDEARVKLSAVAERDPLAQLGMIRIEAQNGASPDQIAAQARKLVAESPSGLLGAVLIEAHRKQVGMMPMTTASQDLRCELDRFPREWLDLLDMQKVRNFYVLKAAPIKVGHRYAEPILVKVTIQNVSNFDITLGPEGAIRPDLWFDVHVKGLAQQHITGVAFERLGQQVLLKPKQLISQVVRVDQDGLATMLSGNPTIGVPLYFSLLTNPITQQAGIAPGPCGYRVQFTRVIERAAAPFNPQAMQQLFADLLAGSADVRIRTLDLLSAYAAQLAKAEDPDVRNRAAELVEVIRKSMGDDVPAVRAWATYDAAMLADAPVREGMIRQLLSDPDFTRRVLGVAAVQMLDPPMRKEMVRPLAESDADPVVRKLAAAVIEVADLPPPATQPTEPEQ